MLTPLQATSCWIQIVSYTSHDTTFELQGHESAVVSGLAHDKNTYNANTMLASSHEAI